MCGRKNPNLSQCVTDSSNNMKDNLCEGIPEMEIPPLKLLTIPKLILSDTNNVRLYVKDAHIMGLCNFVVNNANVDLDKLKINLNISIPNVLINSTYDFNIHVMVPIISKGRLFLTVGK